MNNEHLGAGRSRAPSARVRGSPTRGEPPPTKTHQNLRATACLASISPCLRVISTVNNRY